MNIAGRHNGFDRDTTPAHRRWVTISAEGAMNEHPRLGPVERHADRNGHGNVPMIRRERVVLDRLVSYRYRSPDADHALIVQPGALPSVNPATEQGPPTDRSHHTSLSRCWVLKERLVTHVPRCLRHRRFRDNAVAAILSDRRNLHRRYSLTASLIFGAINAATDRLDAVCSVPAVCPRRVSHVGERQSRR